MFGPLNPRQRSVMRYAASGQVFFDGFFTDASLGEYDILQQTAGTVAVSVVGEKLVFDTIPDQGQVLLKKRNLDLADATFGCVLTESNDGGLAFRVMDYMNYYLVSICDDSNPSSYEKNKAQLWRCVNGSYTNLGSVAISFPRGTPQELSVKASGSALDVYFNGAKILSANDSTFTHGGIAARANRLPDRYDSLYATIF